MLDWQQFLTFQEKEFGKEVVDRWLRTLEVRSFDACNLYLEAKDSFQILWFDEHIRHKLPQFVNRNQKPVKVHLSLSGIKKETTKSPKQKASQKQSTVPNHIFFEDLDPSCALDEFVISEENQIAYKILEELCAQLTAYKLQKMSSFCQASSTPPVSLFNPIYLYGPSGSGKTHLLMAITQKLKRMGYNAIYARTELFTDHVVKSIRIGEMSHFRNTYRNADILLIDNVQCLGRKNATQEEFFHTFNALHTAGKQIILAGNVVPQSLSFIEPRLISRFEWGISLALCAPEKKDLIKLIENKAIFFDYPLPPRISEFLAISFPTNPKSAIRALEALILRSHLGQKGKVIPKQTLSIAHVKELLNDLIENEKAISLSPERIITAAAEHYGLLPEDLCGKSQTRDYVIARQIAMYLCRLLLKIPYMKIGDIFSRDHSTVMSAIKQVQKQVDLIQNDIATACNAIQLKLTRAS